MRKTRLKMVLVVTFAAIALLFAGSGQLHAQSVDSDFDPFNLPTGNFVSAAEAQVLLNDQIAPLKGLIQTLTPGTVAFFNTERAINFYATIFHEVVAGKAIPLSIMEGIKFIAEDANGEPYGGATKTELLAYKQDAVDLLSQ